MENVIQREFEPFAVQARTISVITAEVKAIKQNMAKVVLSNAIEIGRRLVEAKEMLDHGEWGPWIEKELDFTQASANNYMRLFKEYGAAQLTVFGAVMDNPALEGLDYTKALHLLSVPKEDREAFAAEVDAQNISTRELDQAIKERNDAIRAKEEAEKKAEELSAVAAEIEDARKEREAAKAEADALRKKAESSGKEMNDAKEKVKKLSEDLKKEKSEFEQKKKQLEKEAAERAEKSVADKLRKAEDDAKAAKAREMAAAVKAKQAEEKLEELKKSQKLTNPAVLEFKSVFDQMQKLVPVLRQKIDAVRKDDPETADKLAAALRKFAEVL